MLIQAVMTAGGAFAATNVDDIVILSLFCARLRHWRQALPLFLGKTLGFGVLVLISLLGLLGTQLLAPPWLGLLGLVPISLGLLRWRQRNANSAQGQAGSGILRPAGQPWAGLVTMAGLTLANGADNIGVYLPLFAQSGGLELLVTLATFAVGLALLGLLAWGCSRTPGLPPLLSRLGEALVPLVLIVLGSAILLDGLALDPANLTQLQGVLPREFNFPGLKGSVDDLSEGASSEGTLFQGGLSEVNLSEYSLSQINSSEDHLSESSRSGDDLSDPSGSPPGGSPSSGASLSLSEVDQVALSLAAIKAPDLLAGDRTDFHGMNLDSPIPVHRLRSDGHL